MWGSLFCLKLLSYCLKAKTLLETSIRRRFEKVQTDPEIFEKIKKESETFRIRFGKIQKSNWNDSKWFRKIRKSSNRFKKIYNHSEEDLGKFCQYLERFRVIYKDLKRFEKIQSDSKWLKKIRKDSKWFG